MVLGARLLLPRQASRLHHGTAASPRAVDGASQRQRASRKRTHRFPHPIDSMMPWMMLNRHIYQVFRLLSDGLGHDVLWDFAYASVPGAS